MRWVLACLILINAGYLAWQYLSETAEEKSSLLMEQGDERLAQKCLYLGRFAEAEVLSLAQRLKSLDVGASVVRHDINIGGDYWVYVPAQATKERATQLQRELALNNLDAYVIAGGEYANGLSLGTYTNAQQAQERQVSAQAVKVQAYIKMLPRTQAEYWLKIAEHSARLVDDAFTDRLKNDFPALLRELKSCESIASRIGIQ